MKQTENRKLKDRGLGYSVVPWEWEIITYNPSVRTNQVYST